MVGGRLLWWWWWSGDPQGKLHRLNPTDARPATEGNTSGHEKGFRQVMGVVGHCRRGAGPEQTCAAREIASEQLTKSQGRFTV